jgi:Bacterial protein of unknown function (DUF916)
MHPSRPLTTTAVGALAHAAAVVLLAALGLVVLGAGPAAAADDAPWAVRTASNEFGSERPNYSYTLNPGGHLEDGLVVVNHGTTPLDLALYAADGFTTDAGRLDLVTKDTTSTGVGAWVHAGRDHVTIQPGKSAEVPFTVTLPANATPGDHLGGIVTSLTQASAGRTNVERRLALRIRLRVGGELKPSLSVKDVHVDHSDNPSGKGDATITYTIHNTGNAILTARQAASISGPFGRMRVRSGQVDDSPQLLPGDTWKVSVPIHGVAPAVPLTGTVTVVPLLTDASGSIGPLAAVETTTHARTTPTALLLLIVLCGLVVVVLAARRRRQAKLREDAHALALRERETSDQ